MRRVPEIGAENPYQKSGTINRHDNGVCPINYQKLIPENFGTKLHVRSSDTSETGTGFLVDCWRRFLLSVSWTLGTSISDGITVSLKPDCTSGTT